MQIRRRYRNGITPGQRFGSKTAISPIIRVFIRSTNVYIVDGIDSGAAPLPNEDLRGPIGSRANKD